ncbi:MAG TPA: aldo/keto reductase [Candidatus Binatia bacterium]|nr:aldo/keto reductase [Candidatus Binatia bacterium]
MQYTILGRTGLKVSVAGLGCGGPSRLGLRNGSDSAEHAVSLIKQALDLGVNFLDTAQNYGTEPMVGNAIRGAARDKLIISTKKTLPSPDHPHPEEEVRRGLEQSLKLLATDYIDVYHLHGVEPKDYRFAKERLMPEMRRLKEQGKIRFIGVTEGFVQDPKHEMLRNSLEDDLWDVVMVGYNLLNPSARKTVFPLAQRKQVGMLNMFAVRRALSQPDRLNEMVAELLKKGEIPQNAVNSQNPLDFVLSESDAVTLPEAAYRYCRHTPGIHVVLTGTGNPDHLRENVAAITKPALPEPVLEKLATLFGKLDFLTGN